MKNKLKWKKWNAYDGDGDEVWECPECEFELLLSEGDPWDNEYYFCPKCGADLREKTKKKSKIKPCPFCGGEATLTEYKFATYKCKVECTTFGCGISTMLYEGEKADKKAIEAWNRRAE